MASYINGKLREITDEELAELVAAFAAKQEEE